MRGLVEAALIALVFLCGSPFVCSAESQVDPTVFLSKVDSLRAEVRNGEALELIESALPSARETGDEGFLLELLTRQGCCLTTTGRSSAGVPVLIAATELAESRCDTVLWCDGLRWLGVARGIQGEAEEARLLYERVFALAAASGQHEFMGWAQVGLGWQDFRAGRNEESARRYRDAVAHFTDMVEVREPCPERGLIWAWNGVGLAEQALGNFDPAMEGYNKSATLARQVGQGIGESMAVNNLGSLAFSLGAPGAALDHFVRARDLQLEFGNTRGAVKPALNIVMCRMGLGRYSAAEADLDSIITFCRSHQYVDLEAIARNQKADLVLTQGRQHQAAEMFQGVLDLPSDLPLKTRVEARIGLARALSALGRTEEALAVLQDGRDEIADRGSVYQSLLIDAESALLLQALDRHREALTLLLRVKDVSGQHQISGYRMRALARAAASCRALDRPDSALAFLQEAALDWERERNLPLNPEWREQRGLVGRIVFIDLAVMMLAQESEGNPDRNLNLAFDQLQVFKARTLLERLLGPGRTTSHSVEALEPIRLEDFQQRVLASDELLLDLYLGPEVSLLFAVTSNECRVLFLPADRELNRQIRPYSRFLSRRPQSAQADNSTDILREASSALWELLLADLDDLLAANRLVFFSPDAITNLLPAAALMPVDSELTWARIPSATVLAKMREIHPPDSDPLPGRILSLVGGAEAHNLPLPGAIHESKWLARNFREVDIRICDWETNEDKAPFSMAALADYEILHLATHTSLNDENPWQSSILLPGFGDTGQLTAAGIASSRLGARLAVLSACGSGSGRILSGEGVLGLTSAFISAGVPAVVATLWPVDDATTAQTMAHFYKALSRGANAANALQTARQAVRSDPATSHPFFWAGYILVGDGQVQVTLERRWPVRRLVLGVMGLVALGLFLFTFRFGR